MCSLGHFTALIQCKFGLLLEEQTKVEKKTENETGLEPNQRHVAKHKQKPMKDKEQDP